MSEIVDRAKKNFEKDQSYWEPIYNSAREDLYFLSDKPDAQWSEHDLKDRERSGRPALTIDQLGQYVNQVVNDIRKNTPEIEVIPDIDGTVESAEVQQDIIRDILYNSDADTCFDTAAAYQVKGSVGFIRIDTSYVNDNDFNQQLKVYTVEDPLTCYLDCDSTSLVGDDAKRATMLECVDKDTFEKEYPGKAAVSFTDDKYVKGNKDDIVLAHYYEIETKKKKIGLTLENTIEEVQEGVEYVQKREVEEKVVKRYLLSGEDVLKSTEFVGENIPLVPVYGNQQWVNGEREINSLIRRSKDAQRMFNFWKSLETELLQQQPRASFMAAIGQVEEFPDQWENPEKSPVLPYKPSDVAGNPVPPPQRLDPPQIPTGIVNAARSAVDDIKATIGMYAASLGQESNEVSGVAIQRRNEEGETATYHFSDNLSKSIARVGKILRDALPFVYDTPRYVSSIDKEGNVNLIGINGAMVEGQEQSFDITQGGYKTKVVTGPSYTTQRQEAANFFNNVVVKNPELMGVMGDLLFKNIDIAGAEAMAERMRRYIDPKYLEKEGEYDPEKEQMLVVINEGQRLIEEQAAQIEDMADELRDKNTELAIKAKSEESKNQTNAEKNDLELLKIEADNVNRARDYQFKMEALKLKEKELELKALDKVVAPKTEMEFKQYNDNPENVEVEMQT